ncbi:Pimeloyl-ACP methyl ester carboxylesterase [Flavobacterium degerlachei]|jgi:pimeloyl-ACP methyl ester carboxylesterase|uniref:Pimeloyl-ACP methyl ester carboxylesterase n=2 Tax=Flavobacterium degerlachei TaxID=229203 RepID=A0A1H2Y882_9FLAO|nr:Pimeloyl-ACP methyl ester carboxylesterase [Flavobacterium degerlachei]
MIKMYLFLSLIISTVSFSQKAETMKNTTSEYKFATHCTKIDNLEIAYIKEGKGKQTIVFIHGLSSNADAWSRNIENLKEKYTCVALDLPGFGKSSKVAPAYTPIYYADIVVKLIDKLKLKNVIVAGHSMGGQAAIKLALNHPEKLKKLILIAPAGIEEFNAQQSLLMKNAVTADMVSKTTDKQIDRNYQLNFFKLPEEAQTMISDRKKIKQATDFPEYCDAIVKSIAGMLDESTHAELNLIAVETLVVFGENDNLIPNRYLNPNLTTNLVGGIAQEKIKNSTLHFVSESGHFVQFEKPTEVNRIITTWLE